MKNPEKAGIAVVAQLLCVSARTAPKSGGGDVLYTKVVTEKEKNAIADDMLRIADFKEGFLGGKKGKAMRADWISDAEAFRRSDEVVLIGVEGRKVLNINCGGCGYATCADMLKSERSPKDRDFPGPFCMFRIMDLSVAFTSAAKTAMEHNVDNRLMQKAGVAVLRLKMMKPCNLVVAVPLSATGKNIYFDRSDKISAYKTIKY